MGVQCVLVVLLMFAGTVEAKAGVTIWGDEVTLTCPKAGDWYRNKNNTVLKSNSETYEFQYDGKARYRCDYSATSDTSDPKIKYEFYVEGKISKRFFELNAFIFGMAMILDLTFTSVLMIVIYRCTKKKNPAAPSHSAAKAPARPGARPPPVPSVDYEPLNLNTRSQDTYSMVNRTG